MVVFGNKCVTVFNKVIDETTGKTKYIPHLLEKVNLVSTRGANIRSSGIENADTARLYVKMDNYKKPVEWQKLSNEEKEVYCTFTPQEDFFVRGNLMDLQQEYGFFESIKENYDDVFVVTTCDVYEDILPHIEVGGR